MKKLRIVIVFLPFLISVANFRLINQPNRPINQLDTLINRLDVVNTFGKQYMLKLTAQEITDLSEFLDFNKNRTATNYIAIHHTATDAPLPEIVDYHMFRKHWRSVAYHYYIDKHGRIFRLLKPESTSAHAKQHNSDAVSVCFQGNFDRDSLQSAQYKAGLKLVYALHTKYPNAEIVGHREIGETACPGINFPLDRLKFEVTHFHIIRILKWQSS